MCLYIDRKATENFKRNNRYKKVTVYKDVIFEFGSIVTRFQVAKVKPGFLISDSSYIPGLNENINGGVIHAYTKNKKRRKHSPIFRMKCWAYASDFIAKGQCEDICFKKIFIPKSEYDKAKKCLIY